MELDFVRIECDVVTDASAPLDAALSDGQRSFEAHFKACCCLNVHGPCSACTQQAGCPYRIVFNQSLSTDPEIVRIHQKPSLPFALYINTIEHTISSCTAGIVVIGSTLQYVELFHAALLRMVEATVSAMRFPARFTLRTFSLDYQGARQEISSTASLPENVILLSGRHILQNTVHSDSIQLTLKSPLRVLNNGSIAHRFDFMPFFRSQLRRCSSLCAYYGSGTSIDLDFAQLSRQAERVTLFDNTIQYSLPPGTKRQNRAGLTGSVECAGLVEPMFSLLLLGSYFNAGKGATFGSGFHTIEVE